uniref:hypothetical protein n=1 Tax=Legionella waltersii TaxID=66969 RepID=UPI001E4FBBFC|nr:hypothetical protein [Legionella waltersii]
MMEVTINVKLPDPRIGMYGHLLSGHLYPEDKKKGRFSMQNNLAQFSFSAKGLLARFILCIFNYECRNYG